MVFVVETGMLRVGFKEAATLGKWTLTHRQLALNTVEVLLVANIKSCDGFWSAQPLFTVGLWMGGAWWLWTGSVSDSRVEPGAAASFNLSDGPIACAGF